MSGLDAMISEAEKCIGMGEPNKIQRWYDAKFGVVGGSNWPWCDAAVTYWAWQSGNEQAVTFGGGYCYTVAHAQRFKQSGQWHVDTDGIRRGDVLFFDWEFTNTIAAIDHVGIVTGVDGGNVLTIEGNTNNVCARRVRQADVIAGYGRPNYPGAQPTPPDSTPTPKPPAGGDNGKPWVYAGQLNHAAAWDPPAEQGHRSYSWPQVLLVEKALNREGLLPAGRVDGSWGTTTIAAYSAWQRKLGFRGADANGLPGVQSLQKLADKYGTFRVGA